jgi:hypothetical protein
MDFGCSLRSLVIVETFFSLANDFLKAPKVHHAEAARRGKSLERMLDGSDTVLPCMMQAGGKQFQMSWVGSLSIGTSRGVNIATLLRAMSRTISLDLQWRVWYWYSHQ